MTKDPATDARSEGSSEGVHVDSLDPKVRPLPDESFTETSTQGAGGKEAGGAMQRRVLETKLVPRLRALGMAGHGSRGGAHGMVEL